VTVVPAPVITSFTAAAAAITRGDSTTLTAVFTGGTGSVDNGVGTVTSGTPVTVTLTATTTYTLTVMNSAGTSVTASATVSIFNLLANGVNLVVPPGLSADPTTPSAGGPISLNNFGSNYLQGGFVPAGGAKINIASIPLPTPPLGDLIFHELEYANIMSTSAITVSGASCTEEFYAAAFAPSITYTNVALYCPSSSGVTLYKIYLSYNAGDAQESTIQSLFQQLLNGVQFTQ